MMTGFWVSKVLFTGVELGIFDELANGPASAEVLAYRLRVHPEALGRLLNALVAMELLQHDVGRYRNTPEAQSYLVGSQPTYIGGQVEHLSQLHWRLWQYLPDAVRENSPRVQQVFGPVFNILQAVSSDPQRLRTFIQGMHNLSVPAAQEILETINLSSYKCIMDVGGGSGALAIAAVQKHPQMRGIVFDLPAVCPIAEEYILKHGVGNQVKTHSGDFFDPATLPKDADVIALEWVLRDWQLEQGRVILRNCFSALRTGGAIIICEKLLERDKTKPLLATLMDLHVMVSTGGQEHTRDEYCELMESVGLRDVQVNTLKGNRDVVIGYKR
jgi:hypothetical protein